MAEGDDKKTRRIDRHDETEADPTVASTRTDAGSGSSTEINQPADRFTLTQVLGEGTQGEVCKAFDNLLHRHVAIKFPRRVDDDRVAQDILSEARKAARLNHPNVVTIYEVGFWKGRPFIAMELVEGVSLATILKECGRVSVDRYLKYARQILRALGAAHRSGLIHRDLKPHNVLLSAEGTLKLTDFGVAHVGSGVGADKTVQFKIAGTPAYMAPEQWSGLTPDARSDLYAFGAMSFKLLTGQNVFPAEDTMRHHLESKPKPIRSLAPNVPEALDRILLRCLEKRPEDRFQSAKELLEAIEKASRSGEGTGTAAWPIEDGAGGKKRGKTPILLALLVLVLGGAAVYLFALPQGKDLREKLMASLGLAKDKPKPKPEPRPEPRPGPEEQPDPDLAAAESAEREKRLAEGREALEAAWALAGSEDLLGIDERIRLAEYAAERLKGTTEGETARRLAKEARTARAQLTERAKVEGFRALLAQGRREIDEDLDAAAATFARAEAQMTDPVLGQLSREYSEAKQRLPMRQAEAAARSGRFDDAASYFEEYANVLDSLDRPEDKAEQKRIATTMRTLDFLARNCAEQPRYVAVELAKRSADLDRFPAGRLIEARAWLSLGGQVRCRRALETLLATGPEAGVADEAKRLLALLANE